MLVLSGFRFFALDVRPEVANLIESHQSKGNRDGGIANADRPTQSRGGLSCGFNQQDDSHNANQNRGGQH